MPGLLHRLLKDGNTDTDPTGEFRYDPATGQASYGGSATFQYNVPIHTLPAPPTAPVVPWWSTLWNGVKHVVHVVASIVHAVVHKPASPQDVVGKGLLKAASQNSSCNAQGFLQVFCGDTIAQWAGYLPGGGQIGIPGPFHLGSGQGGGGGSHDHGGSDLSEVMYNDSGGTGSGGSENWSLETLDKSAQHPYETLPTDVYRGFKIGEDPLALKSGEISKKGFVYSGLSHFTEPTNLPVDDWIKIPKGTQAPEGLVWNYKWSDKWGTWHVGLEPTGGRNTMTPDVYNALVNALRDLYRR